MAFDSDKRERGKGGLGGGGGSAVQGRGGGGSNAPRSIKKRKRGQSTLAARSFPGRHPDVPLASTFNETPRTRGPQGAAEVSGAILRSGVDALTTIPKAGLATVAGAAGLAADSALKSFEAAGPIARGVQRGFTGDESVDGVDLLPYREVPTIVDSPSVRGGERRLGAPHQASIPTRDPLSRGLRENIDLTQALANRPTGSNTVLAEREAGRREIRRGMLEAKRAKEIAALRRPGKKTRFGTPTTVGGRSGVANLMKAHNEEDRISALLETSQLDRESKERLGAAAAQAGAEGAFAKARTDQSKLEETKRANLEEESLGKGRLGLDRLKAARSTVDSINAPLSTKVALFRSMTSEAETLRAFPQIAEHFKKSGERQVPGADMIDAWLRETGGRF